jgi:3-dehydroquinate dehydratase-1
MTAKGLLDRGSVIVGVLRTLSLHAAERAHEQGADALEVRIDLLPEAERGIAQITEFISRLPLPVIVTNRKKEEGGAFPGTEEERLALLRGILETATVAAVDLELSSSEVAKKELVEKAASRQVSVIFSFHDFHGTPPRTELVTMINRMFDEGASVAKVVVTPKTLSDALGLLALTYELSESDKRVVVFGMGPIGRHLRVIASLYGSILTYGYIEGEEAVAPGQFSVRALKSILEQLGVT